MANRPSSTPFLSTSTTREGLILYCFDRHQQADRRHEKIFSTIARDLADRDPKMRRALASAVQAASSLKKTADIIQQWQKLLVEPLWKSSGSTAEPILIVIDALDERGTERPTPDSSWETSKPLRSPNHRPPRQLPFLRHLSPTRSGDFAGDSVRGHY